MFWSKDKKENGTAAPSYKDYVMKEFKYSLLVMQMEKDDQIKYHYPTCAICDMLIDFETHSEAYMTEFKGQLGQEKLSIIGEINREIDLFNEKEFDCDPESLNDETWKNIRMLAKRALKIFGWEKDKVPEFTKIKDGLWRRE